MHYLNYVNRLQERGLQKQYIKELTGVSIEARKGRSHRKLTPKQLDVCLNAVRRDKYGLLRVLDIFPQHNPNEIYRSVKAYLQPFNASEVLKELILALARDGVAILHINMLIEPLIDTQISYSSLLQLTRGIHLTRSKLSFSQRQGLLIEILKCIHYKGVSQDYRGYFLLKTLFPWAESKIITTAIAKSIDYTAKACTICGSEFLASKNVLFCGKCKKNRRAV